MATEVIETGTPLLKCTLTDRVATVTFNYPEKKNALAYDMKIAAGEILSKLEFDNRVGAVVLTGAGGAFCAGGDVGGMGDSVDDAWPSDTEAMVAQLKRSQKALTLRYYEFPKPVIAAIAGPAAGAGMSLALACDMRICGESGFLYPAFGKIALSGDHGGSWLMTQLVGPAKAREIYFTNQRVGAEEALSLGLVNRVCPDDELLEVAQSTAAKIASFSPLALQYMKENLSFASNCDFRTAQELEAERMVRTLRSDDHREGVAALMEKRKPQFGTK